MMMRFGVAAFGARFLALRRRIGFSRGSVLECLISVSKDKALALYSRQSYCGRSTEMRAYARRTSRPGKFSKRKPKKYRTVEAPPPPPTPPAPPLPNIHYEAGWNDSWSFRRCLHEHRTLLEAAKCGKPQGCGWYVFAVENGEPRQLHDAEEEIVDHFRYGKDAK
jgi:hypothetical protein